MSLKFLLATAVYLGTSSRSPWQPTWKKLGMVSPAGQRQRTAAGRVTQHNSGRINVRQWRRHIAATAAAVDVRPPR